MSGNGDRITGIVYARVSPRRDVDESQSCEAQRVVCVEHCRKVKYYHDPKRHYFEDHALSGHEADRPGLWAAIDALDQGDRLVVRWRSRLARDVYLDATIERAVKARKAWIEAVEDGHNEDTPQDQLIRRILAAFSEYERECIRLRTKHGMRRHQVNGRRMSRWEPYGYKPDPMNPKLMIEHPREQQTIKHILEMREQGLSYYRIRQELIERGCAPRGGKEWAYKVLQNIVRREEDRARVKGDR